jgi:hypothetical protein
MGKLILNPTDTSQWHALVNEAQISCHTNLDEEMESYLVFLLMRFAQKAKLIESIVAVDFLESLHLNGNRRVHALRDVGDKSLLFCGLFPGVAKKRRVSLEYFIDMGQAAYLTASEVEFHQWSQLFCQLSEGFTLLKEILSAMRSQYLNITNWDDTKLIIPSDDNLIQ